MRPPTSGKPSLREIDHARRLRNAPVEPRLDGVAVGRGDVGWLRAPSGRACDLPPPCRPCRRPGPDAARATSPLLATIMASTTEAASARQDGRAGARCRPTAASIRRTRAGGGASRGSRSRIKRRSASTRSRSAASAGSVANLPFELDRMRGVELAVDIGVNQQDRIVRCSRRRHGSSFPRMAIRRRRARAKPRHHGADRDAGHLRDLAIVEPLDVAQHQRLPKRHRQLPQSRLRAARCRSWRSAPPPASRSPARRRLPRRACACSTASRSSTITSEDERFLASQV